VRLPGTPVAVHIDHPDAVPDPAVVEATQAAAGALRDAGLVVAEVAPPGLDAVRPNTLD
jgi:hypothetical protein